MVSLKFTPEEMVENVSGVSPMAEPPEYPYGTCLCLNEKLLEKLGVDHTDWKIGDEFSLDVLVKVKSISENSAELQITDIEPEEHEDAEEKEHESDDDLEPHGYSHVDEAAEHLPLRKFGYSRSGK